MKKLNCLLILMAFSLLLSAQEIPQKISYQGKLLENGYPVTGTKSIMFTIGTWNETKSVQVTDGLYSVTLGNASNPIPISIFNNSTNVTLQISVEGTNLTPQTEILSVAYAFKAERSVDAEKLNGQYSSYYHNWNNLNNIPADIADGDDVDDADNDPNNEYQSLSQSGLNVTLSNNGGTVSVADNDNDTDNECQTLSVSGNTLSISPCGNSVQLPSGGITQLNQGSGIILSPNPITSTGTINFENPFNGDFSATNTISTDSPSSSFDGGDIVADDDLISDDDIEVGDNAYINDIIYLNDDHDNTGGLLMSGDDGDNVVLIGFASGTNGLGGGISTYYSGNQRSYYGITSTSGGGYGRILLYDHNGNITVHLNGESGLISGTSKQFRVDHPLDHTKDIVYTCIEGPEAAAYFRGTAKLIDGKTFIEYSEHFSLIINKATITVNLTPLSAASKGLAVIQKSELGFEVKELFQGNGNYEFDYEVKGVRLGYEDYKVIQDKITPSSVYLPIKEDKGSED